MKRRVSLVLSIVALAALALLGAAGPATANRPTEFSAYRIGFECSEFLTNEHGTLAVSAFFDRDDFDTGFIEYWVPPDTPETGSGTYRSSSERDATVTVQNLQLRAVVPMEDRDFNQLGDSIIEATLVPSGEPEVGAGKTRFGNRWTRDNSVSQPLTASGTVTLFDGNVFEFSGCEGAELTIDVRESDPSQFVLNLGGILVLCDLVAGDSFANLGSSTDESGTSAEVAFSGHGSTLAGFADTGLTLTSEIFEGTIPLFDLETEEPAGDAIIDATFARGPHTVVRTQEGSIRINMSGFLLEPTGTLTITHTGTVFDMSSCFAFDGREQHKEHRPRDPAPE